MKGRELGKLAVDGRITLSLILKKYGVGIWTEFIWLRLLRQGISFCEDDDEQSGSIKGRNFLNKMSDYQLPKKDSDSCSYLVINKYCIFSADTKLTKTMSPIAEPEISVLATPKDIIVHDLG